MRKFTFILSALFIGQILSAQNNPIKFEISPPEKKLVPNNEKPSLSFTKTEAKEPNHSKPQIERNLKTETYSNKKEDLTEKLDSLITKNSNGDYFSKQVFTYKDNKYYTNAKNYFWDNYTKKWDLVQEFINDYDENGNVLSQIEQNYLDYVGVKVEYVYNSDNKAISTKYATFFNEDWEYIERLDHEYTNGDITLETGYKSYDGTENWTKTFYAKADYDNLHRQKNIEQYYLDGTDWVGLTKAKYEYYENSKDKLTLYEYYEWLNGENWKANQRVEQTFDNNYITKQTLLMLNYADNTWTGDNSNYTIFKYDNLWKITEETNYVLDQNNNNTYVPKISSLTEYSKQGNIDVSDQKTYEMISNNWELADVLTKHFDDRNNLLFKTEKFVNGNYEDYLYEENYEYDSSNNRLSEYYYNIENGNKIATFASKSTYDSNNNPKLYIGYNGNGQDGWEESRKWEYEYTQNFQTSLLGYIKIGNDWYSEFGDSMDVDKNVSSDTLLFPTNYNSPFKILNTKAYNTDGGSGWIIDTSEFHYSKIEKLNTNDVDTQSKVLVYPNPTNGIIHINATKINSVQLYDLTGKLIKESNKNILDITSLPKGIYIINVDGNSSRIIKK
ncbi:T9SS type A sorting domain-containing protein [Empedobacter sp. UBA7248]|uniref:T9SS type A sorting domain-containing protein n=1 Tax=Empedobacter sp. UBA7248 TaxID=1946448 RepID=UPI0025BB135F|nr:T9SS type A sorting domain-containing protein [Empedobacter sp. UBA7248]